MSLKEGLASLQRCVRSALCQALGTLEVRSALSLPSQSPQHTQLGGGHVIV